MSRRLAAFLLGFWLFGAWPLPHAALLPTDLPKSVPMLAEQPLADFQARRARLRAQLKDGIVLVPGRIETSLGVSEKFFQDENFFYLTGVEAPGATLLLTPVPYQGAQEILFLPRRDPQMERWTGPQPGPDQEAEQRFGMEKALPTDTLSQVLREIGAAWGFAPGWQQNLPHCQPAGDARTGRPHTAGAGAANCPGTSHH